jgi:multidrug efflux pump subunit AcrA (membrane-fusion protein)
VIARFAFSRLYPAVLVGSLLVMSCGPSEPPKADAESAAVGPEDSTHAPRLTLSDSAIRLAGITTAVARSAAELPDAVALAVPGEVAADPSRVALITPRVVGRLERLRAAVGEQVRAGTPVAELQSPELLVGETEYQLAQKRAVRLSSTPDSAGGWALVEGAKRRLRMLGVEEPEIARLNAGGEPTAEVVITAPFRGSLVDGGALPGAKVEPGMAIFRLIDLSEVDVMARVPEGEISSLRLGQRARVVLDAFPDRAVAGVVERIRDELDPTTRTIEAVLHVSNPGGWMRPGMFGTVFLQGSGGRPSDVVLPDGALVTEGDGQAAFVEVTPGTFERRVVTVVPLPPLPGARVRYVLVRTGIAAGEKVVVEGAFVLKSELGKASFAEEE